MGNDHSWDADLTGSVNSSVDTKVGADLLPCNFNCMLGIVEIYKSLKIIILNRYRVKNKFRHGQA
jgi:hypothetical protein